MSINYTKLAEVTAILAVQKKLEHPEVVARHAIQIAQIFANMSSMIRGAHTSFDNNSHNAVSSEEKLKKKERRELAVAQVLTDEILSLYDAKSSAFIDNEGNVTLLLKFKSGHKNTAEGWEV